MKPDPGTGLQRGKESVYRLVTEIDTNRNISWTRFRLENQQSDFVIDLKLP